jgi:hypothetical protein
VLAVGFAVAAVTGVAVVLWTGETLALTAALIGALLAVRTARSGRRQLRASEGEPVIHELLVMPLALTVAPLSQVVPMVLVGGLAVSAVVRHPQRRPPLTLWALVVAAGLVAVVGQSLPLLLLTAGTTVVVLSGLDRRAVVQSVVDGLGVYLVGNVVAYFVLGINSPSQNTRMASAIETSSGLFAERVYFPFAPSAATGPALAAAFVVGVVPLLLATRNHRALRFAGLTSAALVLVGANYRVPIAITALLVATTVGWPRGFTRAAPFVAVGALLLPFGFGAVRNTTSRVVELATSAAPSLQRHEGGGETLNGRTFIWSATLDRQGGFALKREALGWGPAGHIESGVSRGYAFRLRGGFVNPLWAGPHNSALQQLVDGGWLGFSLLVGGVGVTAARLGRWGRRDPYGMAGLGVLVAMAIAGATESVVAPGLNAVGYATLLGVASVAMLSPPPDRRSATRVRGVFLAPT